MTRGGHLGDGGVTDVLGRLFGVCTLPRVLVGPSIPRYRTTSPPGRSETPIAGTTISVEGVVDAHARTGDLTEDV